MSSSKRLFDIAASLTCLLVLSPLLLAIAIAVKIDSPGPALYVQERVGRKGKLFRLLKFRTMRVGADKAGPLVTKEGDSRITRVGHWLRNSKLDELPQLFNVLRGDMSLVGPRPEVPRYVEVWPDDARSEILAVRPGITDPASVEYFDEAALLRNCADVEQAYLTTILPRKLEIYRQYVRDRSFVGDIAILMQTAARLLRRGGWRTG